MRHKEKSAQGKWLRVTIDARYEALKSKRLPRAVPMYNAIGDVLTRAS